MPVNRFDFSHCQTYLSENETLSKFNIHQIINFISQSNISGVVIMQKLEIDVLDQLKLRTPLVQCSEFNEVNDISYITIDNLEATRKMLRYILNTGRKQVALVNSDPARYTYAKLRLQGYCETLEQAGIAVNPLHIVTVPDGNFSTAVSAISALLKTAAPPGCHILCIRHHGSRRPPGLRPGRLPCSTRYYGCGIRQH